MWLRLPHDSRIDSRKRTLDLKINSECRKELKEPEMGTENWNSLIQSPSDVRCTNDLLRLLFVSLHVLLSFSSRNMKGKNQLSSQLFFYNTFDEMNMFALRGSFHVWWRKICCSTWSIASRSIVTSEGKWERLISPLIPHFVRTTQNYCYCTVLTLQNAHPLIRIMM